MPSPAAPRYVDRVEDLPAIAEIAGLSGIEIMRGILTGVLPTPPICRTVGFRLAEVGEGRVVFEGEPGFRHYNVLCGAQGGGSESCSTAAWGAPCILACPQERAIRRWNTR